MRLLEQVLLDDSDEMIWTVDTELVLTYANRVFWERMEHLASGKFSIGRPVLQNGVFSEHLLETWRGIYAQVFNGESVTCEMRTEATMAYAETWVLFRMKPIWVEGVVAGAAGFGRATTNQRLNEDRLRGILNSIPDLVFEHTNDGRVLSSFASAPELLVAPPEEFLGKRMEEFLPGTVSEALLVAFQAVSTSREPRVVNYSLELQGREVFFRAKVVWCNSKTLITVVQDVSKQHQESIELWEMKKTVEQNLRSESLRIEAKKLRILVVDDDDMDREIFGELLEVLGCLPTTVDRGEVALEVLATGEHFDFVLLDMNMPGLGGPATLKAIRLAHARLPVLISTGLANQGILNLVAEIPHVELMTKPFGLERIKAYLEQRTVSKEMGD